MSVCWNCKNAKQLELYNIECKLTKEKHDENDSCDEHVYVGEVMKQKRLNEVYWND